MNASRSRSVRCEFRQINRGCVFLVSAILLTVGIFTRWISGNPTRLVHTLGLSDIIPPIWIMVILFSASYITGGLALGSALGERGVCRPEKKYQGAMWFCIMASLGYAWYPVFFCAELFFGSLVISLLCLFCAICATICFARVSFISFWSMILYDAWLVYLLILNFQIFFMI